MIGPVGSAIFVNQMTASAASFHGAAGHSSPQSHVTRQ